MHIAEQARGWEPEHSLSVAEAIREAMNESTTTSPVRSRSTRRGRPSVESPRDLPAPEPHLPLRKASAHSRLQSRKGPVPKPLFAPTQDHTRVRGFNPSPVQPPLPQLENVTASDEHAFAGREARRAFRPAVGVLENQQQTILQYAEREPAWPERDANAHSSRPPSSPLFPYQASPQPSPNAPRKKGNGLKNSRSVGDGLNSLRHRMTNKRNTDIRNTDKNGRLTPDSLSARPSIVTASDEIRESYRSALTSHSSLGPASSINTAQTSISGRSSPNGSFVKVRREDWDEGGLSDVDMSVEDAIGMYENGFESEIGSAKGSMDVRSLRSVDGGYGKQSLETRTVDRGRLTPDVHSLRSLPVERTDRPLSQPGLPPRFDSQSSTATTTTTTKRPNASHRRSQSASILIVGIPKSARPGASPSPSVRTPVQTHTEQPTNPLGSNPPPPISAVPRDRYGFKKASQHITVEQYDAWNASYSKHIERRSKKWHALMSSYGLQTNPPIRFPPKSDKIKRYVRKGIPPEFRGAAWFWYAGGPGLLKKEPRLYRDLLHKAENGGLSDNDREHIERDLNRTFPDNIRFKPDPTTTLDAQADAGGGGDSPESKKKQRRQTKEPETPILKALRRLLQAFAVHNPQIGYCQSLNFIAGLLLLFLDEDEEKAFILLNVVTTQHLPGTHGIALEGANIDIAVLMTFIKDSLPAIWHRLDDKGGMGGVGGLVSGVGGAGALRLPTVSLATTAWFMSLFVGTLPIESVLRVWDCLFFEGSKTLFRIALSIFKQGEPAILKVSDPMEIFQVVQTIPRGMLDINALMDVCFRRRGGFGGVSQGLVESRRADRRRVVKEGVSAAAEDESAFRRLRGRLRKTATKS